MIELIYEIDKEGSEKDQVLVIRIEEAQRDRSGFLFNKKTSALSRQTLQKLATEKDKEILPFLIDQELRHQKTRKEISSFSQIHIPFSSSIPALKLLAATGKLYFNQRQLVCDFFSPVEFYFHLEIKEQELWSLTGHFKTDKEDFNVQECDFICGGSPHWFVKGILLKCLSTEVNWKDLKNTYNKTPLLSPIQVEQFIKDQEDIGPKILFKENSLEKFLYQKEPLPILILQDRLGAFADLWMDYGEGGRIAYHDPFSSLKNQLKRHLAAEKQWEKDLLETDFIIKKLEKSHYYCPLDKVAKSLSFLLELGWTIYDTKGNRVLKQSNLDLSLQEENQQILIKGKIQYEQFEANLSHVVGAFNRRERFIQLAPGNIGLLPHNWDQEGLTNLIEQTEVVKDSLQLRRNQIGSLDELFNSSTKITLDSTIQKLKEFKGIQEAFPATSFTGQLRPYQQEGVNWLTFLYDFGFHGILADEMGLGKTIQVLAFLSRLSLTKPILIVLPTTLLFNWKKEIQCFLPQSNVTIHHGPNRSKSLETLTSPSIILTSYTTLRLDLELFSQIDYQCLILDEAQAIKNPRAQISQAIFTLKSQFRLSITGTPIENHLSELWSHFHFLIPDLFESETEFLAKLDAASSDHRYLKQIKKQIRPFILRRKKEEVAKDLPEKIEQVVWIEMDAEQRKIYDDFLAGIRGNLLKKVELEGIGKHRIEIFEAILRLRQICCHPLLVSSSLPSCSEFPSCKMDALLNDLETAIEDKRKVLVYSQFTSMLHLISKTIHEKQWKFIYLDGNSTNREKIVSQFQDDPSISLFLISLKAGGVGLNLTAADYVFLYDPWWNDAIENQAINRAHRIGRQAAVLAKRFVIVDTIEEKMMKLKAMKHSLSQDLLGEELSHVNLTEEDCYFLLSD